MRLRSVRLSNPRIPVARQGGLPASVTDITSSFLESRETSTFQDRAARRVLPDDLMSYATRELAVLVRGAGFAPLDNPALEGLLGLLLAFRLSGRKFRRVSCFFVALGHCFCIRHPSRNGTEAAIKQDAAQHLTLRGRHQPVGLESMRM